MIILVRPEQSLPKSLKRFNTAGYSCVGLAVQKICFEPDSIASIGDRIKNNEVSDYQPADYLIVTSQYAAQGLRLAMQTSPSGQLLAHSQVIAVGTTTAKSLEQCFDAKSITTPKSPEQQNSEGILNLPELSSVKHKSIAIIKGESGRSLLKEQLTQRGAQVEEFCVYSRQPVQADFKTLERELMQESGPHFMLVTNGEAASAIIEAQEASFLKQMTWVVISERVAKLVKQQGIKSVLISAGASDDALLKCIQQNME
jgi:uroporphyrinogen-III synthase